MDLVCLTEFASWVYFRKKCRLVTLDVSFNVPSYFENTKSPILCYKQNKPNTTASFKK